MPYPVLAWAVIVVVGCAGAAWNLGKFIEGKHE
jgi:hypothetical protein